MTQPASAAYDVALIHLAPDAKRAGMDYAPTERRGVPDGELRALLLAAAVVAPGVSYPLVPEIRITAPTGKFVVRLKDGRLRFVSWSSPKSSVVEPTVDEIIAIICGEIEEGAGRREAGAPAAGAGGGLMGWKRILAIAGLVVLVVGVNAFTVMRDKRPPGNFLPPYRLLEPEPAGRLLTSVAGNYETGRAAGDRRLQISRDGAVRWIKFGADRAVAEEKTFTVQAAESNGAKALLTSRKSLIRIKDASSLVLFGDTYVRVLN